MEFSPEAIQLFETAGWTPDRDVRDKYISLPEFNACPDFLKQFLYQYGDLTVPGVLLNQSKGPNRVEIIPAIMEEFLPEYLEDPYPFDYKIYPFAYYDPDGCVVACDDNGRVYLLGDFYGSMGEELIQGIQNILLENWEDSLEFKIKTRTWTSKKPFDP